MKAVCREPHAAGMTVTGHIPQNMSVLDGLEDGMDQVNHISFIGLALWPKDFDASKARQDQWLFWSKKSVMGVVTANRIIRVFIPG